MTEQLENAVKALIDIMHAHPEGSAEYQTAETKLSALLDKSDDAQHYAEEYQSLLATLGE
jgi:hypothetical protein